MKKKVLSLIITATLSPGLLTVPSFVSAKDFKYGLPLENKKVDNESNYLKGGISTDNTYSDYSTEVLRKPQTDYSPKSLSFLNKFTQLSTQIINDGLSRQNIFTDVSGQTVAKCKKGCKAYSENNVFLRQSSQIVKSGESTGDTFYDKSSQTVNHGGSSIDAVFNNHSTMIFNEGANASNATFNDNSNLSISSGIKNKITGEMDGVVMNDHSELFQDGQVVKNAEFNDETRFYILAGTLKGLQMHTASFGYLNGGEIDNATLNDQSTLIAGSGHLDGLHLQGASTFLQYGGVVKNSQFKENSKTEISGGETDGAIFNDNSTLIVLQGKAKNVTLNNFSNGYVHDNGTVTGTTTINDNATLHLTALSGMTTSNSPQADTVKLNGGKLDIMTSGYSSYMAGNSQSEPVVSVNHLTVNNGTVSFADTTPDMNGHFSKLKVQTMDGSGGTLVFNTSLASGTGNLLSAGSINNGHYNLQLNDAVASKDVTMKILKNGGISIIETPSEGNKASYSLSNINGEKIDKIDLGSYQGQIIIENNDNKKNNDDNKKNNDDNKKNNDNNKKNNDNNKKNNDNKNNNDKVIIIPITDKTTRSTDALLGALSSGLFISDGEMQSVRSRRGDLQNASQDEGGVWGRYLNDNSHVRAAGTAGYRLQQDGMELGGDKIFSIGNDRLALGLFGSYSKNKLKQDRGNNSNVNSWGTGVYATWFGAQGYYVDGVVKYNHFSTNVRSQTETGRSVAGDFDQNGLGASVETGYRFSLPDAAFIEPFVRTSYFTADGKDVTLSNGLNAKADRLQSIRGEAGATAGKRFDLNSGVTVSPYVTVAVEHEFEKNNNVHMNGAYNFNNDFSGTTGRYGLGVSSQLTRNASVYAEASYRKGEHVESPVMANAGFRLNF